MPEQIVITSHLLVFSSNHLLSVTQSTEGIHSESLTGFCILPKGHFVAEQAFIEQS